MDIVGHRRLFYAISGTLVLFSVLALAVFGLKLGIDFTGGALVELEFSGSRPSLEVIRQQLVPLELGEVRLQPTGERGLLIRLKHIDEGTHQEILKRLGEPPASNRSPNAVDRSPVVEKRFDTIGPTIGVELRRKSTLALALVVALILLYIAWAFRNVSGPVRSWHYGLVTVIALIHDVTIPAGLFSILGFEADTLFVTALLTILGFSVHDTIVVFDRIRENLKKGASHGAFGRVGGPEFEPLVNASVNQTLARSINTSLTVLLAIGAIYLLGAGSTRLFALAMAVGVIAGTYSSIFIASPLLVTWHRFVQRKDAGSWRSGLKG